MVSIIAPDKRGYAHVIFLVFVRKRMLWYSLEAPHQGASKEYPQHMFSCRNKKNIDTFWMKKSSLSGAMFSSGKTVYI